MERAAGRFGGKIVEERNIPSTPPIRAPTCGHQQIQTQMPEVTQGAPEHDVVGWSTPRSASSLRAWGSARIPIHGRHLESTSMAHVIDNATQKLRRQRARRHASTRPSSPPDGKQAWVSSEVGGTISVIDTGTWKAIKKINFAVSGVRPELLQPVGMEFTRRQVAVRGPWSWQPRRGHRPQDL